MSDQARLIVITLAALGGICYFRGQFSATSDAAIAMFIILALDRG